jgi:hypothetical protein
MIEMTWTKFLALDPDAIRDGPCLKVMGGTGDKHLDTNHYHFFVIPRPEGEMTHRIAGIASQIDVSRGL